jgi:nucleoside-diphosphate kinase
MEQTYVMIKPDAVKRKLIGEVIARFEKRGFDIAKMKMLNISDELAQKHYEEHVGKPFFNPLIDFITSGPVVSMIIEGENAVKIVRKMCGPTNCADAQPGTIRGDFSIHYNLNIIHSSDSAESAKREIKTFFNE